MNPEEVHVSYIKSMYLFSPHVERALHESNKGTQ